MTDEQQIKVEHSSENDQSNQTESSAEKQDADHPHIDHLVPGIELIDFASKLQQKFRSDRNYVRSKRKRWATGAVSIRLLAIGFSGTATIMLGLANLSGLAAWGFAFSAVVTLITSLEPFFNFRTRWVSADEALATWYSGEEQLETYIATRSTDEIELSKLLEFDTMRRQEWARFSREWLSERRQIQQNRDLQ